MSGGWDPELQARRQVQLPKLTAEQTRRKEYYYPTTAEVGQKVEKLQERQRRLEAKQAKLKQVHFTLWFLYSVKTHLCFMHPGVHIVRTLEHSDIVTLDTVVHSTCVYNDGAGQGRAAA